MSYTLPTYTLPDWIADEKLLRDEAVLFGLSEARPDEKLAAIRLAFAAQTAPLEKQIEQSHERIGELNGLLETARQELADLSQKAPLLPTPRVGWALLAISLSVSLGVGLALLLQEPLASIPLLTLVLASLLALSWCVVTLLLFTRQQRARLVHHRHQTAMQAATTRTLHQRQGDWQTQKNQLVDALYATEALLTRHNAHRDGLMRLFESEYQLARSVRDRVGNQFLYNE